MSGRWVKLIGLAFAVVLVSAGCAGDEEPETADADKETIKVGYVSTLSGPVAFLGQAPLEGAQIAIQELNQSADFGARFELVTGDDELDPAKAVSATQRLISQDQVDVIVGAGHSGSSQAMMSVTEQAEVVQLTTLSALDALTEPVRPYLFRFWNRDSDIARTLVDFAIEEFEDVGLLYEETAFGVGGKDALEAQISEIGEEFISVQSYEIDAPDISPQLIRLRNAGAQAIIIQGNAPQAALAAQNMRQLGYDAPIIGHPGLAQEGFVQLGEDAVEGAIVIDGLDRSKAEAKEFVDKYVDEYGKDPFSFYPAVGYDAIYLLADALDRADFDIDNLRDSLEATEGFTGVIGPEGSEITYGPDDHDGNTSEALIFKVIENGELVPFKGE